MAECKDWVNGSHGTQINFLKAWIRFSEQLMNVPAKSVALLMSLASSEHVRIVTMNS